MDLDTMKEIKEKAIRQSKYLPTMREQHETLDKEFEAAMDNFRQKRERNSCYVLETELTTVTLQESERLESQETERLQNVQAEQSFYDQLIATEDEGIFEMTTKYEQEVKDISELFRSAHYQYEENTLKKEVESIRSCAFQLNGELAELQGEVEEIKQQFTNKDNISDDGVVKGIDALAEVQLDGVICDNLISAIESKARRFEQKAGALEHELKQANAVKETLIDS